jgi:hypothetical protein
LSLAKEGAAVGDHRTLAVARRSEDQLFAQADVATPEGTKKVVGEVPTRLGGVDKEKPLPPQKEC